MFFNKNIPRPECRIGINKGRKRVQGEGTDCAKVQRPNSMGNDIQGSVQHRLGSDFATQELIKMAVIHKKKKKKKRYGHFNT